MIQVDEIEYLYSGEIKNLTEYYMINLNEKITFVPNMSILNK